MDEQTFRDTAARDGYAEPVIVEWDADTFNDSHTHDFAARIFVLAGEMTVVCEDGDTRTCRTGDSNELAAEVRHSERIGPDGVRFLVARK